MNYLETDEVIGFVDKIIDNVRCSTCNRLEGSRVRYQCGHIACDDCVTWAQDCQTCTSPSQYSETQPKHDIPLSQTVKNAINLLKACHNLFDANAFHRKRISEQLRIEKELFPECIQAPIKYENKRKSLVKIKENKYSTVLPGEKTSSFIDMDHTNNYVQQWLNKHDTNITRKPFSDLNVNTPRRNTAKGTNKHNANENNTINTRKRSHYKTTEKRKGIKENSGSKSSSYENKTTKKRAMKQTATIISNYNNKKYDNDESGIFMENETFIIDDSQDIVIDKDKNAWLAVLQAEEQRKELQSTSLVNLSKDKQTTNSNIQLRNPTAVETKDNIVSKVPFYKKSAIRENCKYCKSEVKADIPVKPQINPVTITIDGDSSITTISVYKNVQNNFTIGTKNTTSVQTDICKENPEIINDCKETDTNIVADLQLDVPLDGCDNNKESEDLFIHDKTISGNKDTLIGKNVIIQESDSDTDVDLSGPISVTVDCHRSCTELDYGILSEMLKLENQELKPLRRQRRPSPTSTNSSEKENYNPNKMKRYSIAKKKYGKK